MDKAVVNALVSTITKEKLELCTPAIRKQVYKEFEAYSKTKAFQTLIRNAVKGGIEDMIEEDFSEYLDSSTVQRVIRKIINKIVGA